MQKEYKKPFNVPLTEELLLKLKEIADQKGIGTATLIRMILIDWLNSQVK